MMDVLLNAVGPQIVGAFPPPPGVVPNFVNPPSRAHQVIIADAIMVPLATLVLGLRLYTRAIIVRNVGSDDYVLILAWFLLIGHLITVILLLNIGMGVNIWNVPLTTFSPDMLKLIIFGAALYGISFLCVKVSILLLYLRLSPYFHFKVVVWVVMVATIAYSLAGSFSFLYGCRPIAKSWDITIAHGKCINLTNVLLAHASLNIVTDVAMLLLPIALVWKLRLPIKQKVAIALLFMAGTFVCIISGVRLKYIIEIFHTGDLTGVGATSMVWSTMEVCVAMTLACLVCFKPFLRRHFPRLLGSTDRSNDASSGFGRAANKGKSSSSSGYGLESTQSRKSSVPQKSCAQSTTIDEIPEDTLGNEVSQEKERTNAEAITQEGRPSETGNFLSDCTNALPVAREGLEAASAAPV